MNTIHEHPRSPERGVEQIRPPNRFRRALAEPSRAVAYFFSRLRGSWYRLKFRLLGRRVRIGRDFRVFGQFDVRGPGTLVIGDHCTVVSTRIMPVTIWTHERDAICEIGDHVVLNGPRIGCTTKVRIGEHAMIADARILDSDFHAVDSPVLPRLAVPGKRAPVVIGRHSWLAAGSMVLKGVTIGENSVVAARAVVAVDVPPNTMVVGNPARPVRELTPRADRARQPN